MNWIRKLRAMTSGRHGAGADLIRATGYPERTVRRWLAGHGRPLNEMDVVARLARALDVDEAWFADPSAGFPVIPRGGRTLLRPAPTDCALDCAAIHRAMLAPSLAPRLIEYAQFLLAQAPRRRAPGRVRQQAHAAPRW